MKRLLLFLLTGLLPAIGLAADEIAVTVYNSNLGVVSEVRTLDVQKGTGRISFRDVPSQIDPNSVRFDVLTPGAQVNILEQNYAFDLVSPDKLYDRYIDQTIELVDKGGRLYSGALLAYSGGSATLLAKDGSVKVVLLGEISEINFPKLPEGLITRPTLFWLTQSNTSGPIQGRVGYQTTGMNWSAEYVGVLNEAETRLDLSGWAAINNSSGKTFKDASLKLVAGEINRARSERRDMLMKSMSTAEADMAYAPGFEEKAFFEYHLYTLPRSATLADREIKQISLFEPASTTVKKIYLYRPAQESDRIRVTVQMKNSEEQGLGMPLPAGRVRLFKADSDGALILLGEDQIDHTPRNEELNLTVGTAFDVKGTFTVTDMRAISSRVDEQDHKIEIRNNKKEAITVKVEQHLGWYWTLLRPSMPFTKKDAYTAVWEVPVPANDTSTVTYTVRYERP